MTNPSLSQEPLVLPLKLTTLTPIHIGTGETMGPDDYVIKESTAFRLNRKAIQNGLKKTGRWEEFAKLSLSSDLDNLLNLRKLIYNTVDVSELDEIATVDDPDFKKRYITNVLHQKNITNEFNQLLVNTIVRSPLTSRPIIPGSSVKGSFRTAFLNSLARTNQDIKGYSLEPQLLQKINLAEQDIFREIAFSDFEMLRGSSYIGICNNRRPSRGVSRERSRTGPPVNLELVEIGSEFVGEIRISRPSKFWKLLNPTDVHTKNGIFDWIRNVVNGFYVDDVYGWEAGYFGYSIPRLKGLSRDAVMRVGKHSGAYAVTIHDYQKKHIFHQGKFQAVKNVVKPYLNRRNTSNPESIHSVLLNSRFPEDCIKKKPNGNWDINRNHSFFYQDHQTTYWESKNRPLGWTTITAISDEEYVGYRSEMQRSLSKSKRPDVSSGELEKTSVKISELSEEERLSKLQSLFNKFQK